MNHQKFTPEETGQWSQEDMEKLVGHLVSVVIPVTDEYKMLHPKAKWEGGIGFVVEAHHNYESNEYVVLWDYGMGWTWNAENSAYVTVCQEKEHGTHYPETPEVNECVALMLP